jgi:hypothetical protein
MAQCLNCGQELAGRQKKYCSRKCKNSYINQFLQSYQAQQRRGRDRKIELIRLKGGQCAACGYDKNFSALEFHHTDPINKTFQLDLRSLSNRKWAAVIEEANKCLLLCSNCHAEMHNPDCFMKPE